jgi:predicted enzyme related to lactoylglutathione lyase
MASTLIWYELLTSDPDAAAAFYGAVLGWKVNATGEGPVDYRIITMNGVAVGGLMTLPAEAASAGMRPGWFGYINVADVDASVTRIVAAGGAVHMPAMDVPGIGRFAMLADPQGARIYVMTPTGTGPATSFAPQIPGHGGWHELHARDWASALAFYSAQFGWNKVDALDMGPLGTYLLFNFGSGEMVGGIMNDANAPRPYWLYYFVVDDIEAAHQRVKANGGEVLMEPHQVPGGAWIFPARDPQGAMFALVGGKR